ncbi:MAG TPA: Crp/Fnr family transcriptional regulator [Caldithrix abyssi]|uniref:Crp/Fnr family transcriptional regulator n=1 Tax=Caldithrix abyssi TaxID=187145 RepID=A0A7V1LNH8_CALAY|nr:Crp/Fnr family transcriptional regulator [Caldithrix abyssi]
MMDQVYAVFGGRFEPPLAGELMQCRQVTVPAGTLLHVGDGRVHHIPLVLKGLIRVSRSDDTGKEILMYHIHEAESCVISLTSCLRENFSNMDTLTVTAEEETTLLLVSDKQVRLWHDRYKSWRAFVTDLYDSRLGEILHLVDAVAFKSVDRRLLDYLRQHKDAAGEVHITHQELAYRIGSAREVVSRLLKQLERDGKLQLFRGRIQVKN